MMEESEVWKPIEGFESEYEVSNMGRVRSLEKRVSHYPSGIAIRKSRIRKEVVTEDGYARISLWNGSKGKIFFVHRLVANAFIPNPNNLPMINHKDENPLNNKADNLEWCTHLYNMNYGTRTVRASAGCSKAVAQYDKEGNLIAVYKSPVHAEKETGFKQTSIRCCCLGQLPTIGGYKWVYINGGKTNKQCGL